MTGLKVTSSSCNVRRWQGYGRTEPAKIHQDPSSAHCPSRSKTKTDSALLSVSGSAPWALARKSPHANQRSSELEPKTTKSKEGLSSCRSRLSLQLSFRSHTVLMCARVRCSKLCLPAVVALRWGTEGERERRGEKAIGGLLNIHTRALAVGVWVRFAPSAVRLGERGERARP